MNPISLQTLATIDTSDKNAGRQLNKLLPPGSTREAAVRQSVPDQNTANSFRLKLEVGSQLLELKTAQPLPQGTQVLLSRSPAGQVSLQLPPTPQPTTTPGTPTTSNTQSLIQIPVTLLSNLSSQSSLLDQLLPQGQKVSVQVIAQPVTAGQTHSASQQQATPTNPQTTQNMPFPQPQTTRLPTGQPAQAPAQPPLHAQISQPTSTQQTPQPAASTPIQAPAPQNPATASTGKVPAASPTTTSPNPAQPVIPQAAQTTVSTSYSAAAQTTGQPLTIKVQGETLQLATRTVLPSLQQVDITRTGPHTALLHLNIPIKNPASASTPDTQPLNPRQLAALEQALKHSLPRQVPVAEGLQQLIALAQPDATSSAGKQVNQLLQSLLNLFGVQPGDREAPQAIRQNIQLGGFFTEAQLAKNKPPAQDMKQFLGKLQTLAEQLPAEQRLRLEDGIEKVLSRITTQQAQHLQQRQDRLDSNERVFQLDLPVKQQEALENVELRLQQREQKNTAGEWETLWRIRLHFDLQDQGRIDADISLNEQQHTLSATFNCSLSTTAEQLQNRLDGFKTQLDAAGLSVADISCRQGQSSSPYTTPVQRTLIDIKT